MATPRALMTQPEMEAMRKHMLQHKGYPYNYGISKNIDNTDFSRTGVTGFRYFTYEFTPEVDTAIVSLATNLLITPETTFGQFGIQLSYGPDLTLADNLTLTKWLNEGTVAYNLFVNGGAINDFQVFYPLNYYVRSRQEKMFIHVFADTTTCTAGTSDMRGQIILGTFPLSN